MELAKLINKECSKSLKDLLYMILAPVDPEPMKLGHLLSRLRDYQSKCFDVDLLDGIVFRYIIICSQLYATLQIILSE